ncbi:MAG: hypothetical protein ACFFC7_02025 [Candidatus Hermodarchaeota archaeon]
MNSDTRARKFKDLITFEPETIKFIEGEKAKLLKEHIRIIKALRQRNLTVKEIHALYYDHEEQEHTRGLKTIYRYLEKLENAGIVAVAGQRMTEGSRLVEKLYCRAAIVFFIDDEDEEKWWISESGREFGQKLNVILSELFQAPEIDSGIFHEFLSNLFTSQEKITKAIIRKAKENEKLRDLFSKTDIDLINKLNTIAALLTTFFQQPELFEPIKKLLK